MKLIILAALCWASSVHCYHILCVFPVPTRSHNLLGKGIVDALLDAGHEVTWGTPYPPKETRKGLNIIDLSVTVAVFENLDVMKTAKLGFKGFKIAMEYSHNISRTALTPQMKTALVRNQYDAVVTEMFFSEADSGYAAIQQVPWILLSGVPLQPQLQGLVDAVNSVPIVPMIFTNYPMPMNFWQRLVTAGVFATMSVTTWLDTTKPTLYNEMWAPLAAARGVPLPSYEEAVHNISILLVNSHHSYATAQSTPPNVVEIGGYHIKEDIAPLPKDLQDILHSSKQGAIYFSLGSVIKSATFPQQTRKELLQLFGKLPYTILWKFEEELPGLPKNVHVRKWMPQDSILAHPNTKAFITHAGGLSCVEAMFHGVPIISIPLYGDQPSNAYRAETAGYGITLEYNYDTITQQLDGALKKVMGTDRYQKRVQQLSTLFKERPVKPSKLISHYVELAIKTKGAYHLRSKALQYTWYQRNMVDIAVFIVGVLATLYLLVKKIIKFIISLCSREKKIANESKGKKKVKRN